MSLCYQGFVRDIILTSDSIAVVPVQGKGLPANAEQLGSPRRHGKELAAELA